MLRNNLLWILLLNMMFFWIVPARALVFQAPSARFGEFRKYALKTNQQTYTQWTIEKSTSTPLEAHSQTLEFAQRALKEKPNKQVVVDWEILRTTLDLNRTDREVLTLLAEKLRFLQELCRYVVMEPDLVKLLEHPDSIQSCEVKASPLPKRLQNQIEDGEILLIDGKVFSKSQIPKRLLGGKYQWKILSDRNETKIFTGTGEEFANHTFSSTNWIQGTCDDYKIPQQDLATLLQSQIYFDDQCIKPGIPPEKNFSRWASEHKTLLWGLGILAAAVSAHQLKDKTLVITKP